MIKYLLSASSSEFFVGRTESAGPIQETCIKGAESSKEETASEIYMDI
jgi:hypothetical protein